MSPVLNVKVTDDCVPECKPHRGTVLQTAKVNVSGKKGSLPVTILFDSGSDFTYISGSLVKKIQPEWITANQMRYSAFGGRSSKVGMMYNVYKVELQTLSGEKEELRATEVGVICDPIFRPRVPAEVFQYFGPIQFADDYDVDREVSIDILIGIDNYWKFVKPNYIQGPDNIVAQDTSFGWIISGSWESCSYVTQSFQLLCMSDIPTSMLHSFWDLDTIGITSDDVVVDPVLRKFNETISYSDQDGRYEVSLPWKEDSGPHKLVNNEQLARSRLDSLSRRLGKDPVLRDRYDSAFREMESTNIICEVPPKEKVVPFPIYYLPHHPVVRESSITTKVQPVFDASATSYNGVSLNDCMEAGPSLIPSLVEILIRFRRWRVALTGDITKAFLQIKVKREDQDVHRFLWEDDGRIRMMRFLRVPFGNKCSPFLLNATIKYHLSKYPASRALEELQDNLYVDDWLSGCDSPEEGCQLYQEARSILSEAGMVLAKSCSNDEVVSDRLLQEGVKFLDSDIVKILGLKWIRLSDSFSYEGVSVPANLTPTKRVILSFLARLFDPLGFLTPFLILCKILLQEIWQLGLDWDMEIPSELSRKFVRWVGGLKAIRDWQIPRCYSQDGWSSLVGFELHVFGDASEKGYAAVVYLQVLRSDGTYDVSFVFSKARVAPLKRLTIPRLELLGALLSARLVVFVKKALRLPDVSYTCWTDSQVVLSWVKGNPGKWKPFVANRVTEIQSITNPANWSYCPGCDNPADMASRGIYAEDLVVSSLWLDGPHWLKTGMNWESPTVEQEFDVADEVNVILVSVEPNDEFVKVIEVERWSSLLKALRVLGWVLRFIHNSRVSVSERSLGDLCYEEIMKAKVLLFRLIQHESFGDEIKALQQGKLISKNSSLLKLDPFLGEDGLLRVKGRLQESDLTYDEKHPILLPKGHLSKLLVRFQHQMLKHAGVGTVITSLRNTYWIIGLRRCVKSVQRECVSCRRLEAPACKQSVAPLPELRVKQSPPFTVTGLDYAGPLFCVDLPSKKFYILLFTCAVVRAVHIELTDSLSLNDFLLALRRFVARRGLPSVFYSDNAKTFVGLKGSCYLVLGLQLQSGSSLFPGLLGGVAGGKG